jgi:hypothetical protein
MWIAATVAGGFFLLVAACYFIAGMWPHTADGWMMDTSGIVSSWLGTLSWAAITWIGVCAWRQKSSWGWRLLLFVGVLAILDRVPGYVLGIYSTISIASPAPDSGTLLETIRMQYFWWKSTGMVLEWFGVLIVLVSGLRIARPSLGGPASALPDNEVGPIESPAEGVASANPVDGASNAAADGASADAEVAGEAAGH